MGLYSSIERRVRGARDYVRLDPVKFALARVVTRAAERCPQGRWLDVGAGSGVHREILRSRMLEYAGLDPSPRGEGVQAGVGEALPWEAASFDAVLLSEVLEHVADPARVLAEVHRVLRPGGAVLVTVPFMFYEHEAPNDFRRYTRHGLRQVLEAAGLKVELLEPVCGLWAVLGIAPALLWLATVGSVPGLWGPALAVQAAWFRAVWLPLDRVLDPRGRWAQGHCAVARKSS